METLSAPLKNKKIVKIKKRAAWLQTFAKAQVLKKISKAHTWSINANRRR